jgi:aminoglycoside phosphotransferase (APT) family kinase protein
VVRAPGPLLASGRDSDIFEYGDGLVLRRSRHQRSLESEAQTMEYARSEGYPVPAVSELSEDGTDLVMERLDGPVMLTALSRRPWTLRNQASVLADLHRRLHEIPAPAWAPDAPSGSGDRLVHLDLHPLNIILTERGPMVIDWTRSARGDGNTDVALTWLLLASAGVPTGKAWGAVLGRFRSALVASFLSHFDRDAVAAELPDVAGWKKADPNMTAAERAAMEALVRRLH